MAIHALVSGTMFRAPEERTAKVSGKAYTTATFSEQVRTEVAAIKRHATVAQLRGKPLASRRYADET